MISNCNYLTLTASQGLWQTKTKTKKKKEKARGASEERNHWEDLILIKNTQRKSIPSLKVLKIKTKDLS
jgi:hypothetical protein